MIQQVFNNCVLHDNNVFKPLIEVISNSKVAFVRTHDGSVLLM